jgi:hypothetical protein
MEWNPRLHLQPVAKDDDDDYDDPKRAPSSSSNPKRPKPHFRPNNKNLQPQNTIMFDPDRFCFPVATMTNLETKPFPLMPPVSIAESQRCNNNDIFQ